MIMDNAAIIDEHRFFRLLLKAMSHPGTIYSSAVCRQDRPMVLGLLACLVDNEVGFTVVGDPELATVIAELTGGRQVAVAEADFLIVANGCGKDQLALLKRGSREYPDQGASLIYLIEELAEGQGGIVISGPGVSGQTALQIKGLDLDELAGLRQINSEFPLGVDAIFIDRLGQIACIPRSSRIGGV